MNYAQKPNNPDLEVAEPATLCYGGRSAIAEPDWASEADHDGDWDDDDVDYGAPESVTVRTFDELWQKLEEGRIAEMEGRVRPIEDFWSDFKRKIANGEL